MTPEERITNMTKAINHAIKIMGDRFGSTEDDVAKAIQGLKVSLLAVAPSTAPQPVPQVAAPIALGPTTAAW